MLRIAGLILVLEFAASLASLPAVSSSNRAASDPLSARTSPGNRPLQPLDDILRYISEDWDRLTRSLNNCATYLDTKTDGKPLLYLPADLPLPPELAGIPQRCSIRIARLPNKPGYQTNTQPGQIQNHGLLYLEHPYVVPGGQFNEMYGWDSYFIIRGLLREGRTALAKGMVENFFFEIEHYGGVLNANRTYYLGRSQPPFLSSMILAVYRAGQNGGAANLDWLRKAYSYAVRDHDQWTRAPHLAGDTGLSRYFDEGEGPVPEIMGDPSDYYRGVAQYFLMHEGEDSPHLVRVDSLHPPGSIIGPIFNFPDGRFGLAADVYKGDRSMRESGFDVSFRFGPFGLDTHHFAPVCLNSLLYKTEMDLEEMSRLLRHPATARRWHELALARREMITKYLWNQDRGLFFDYDFVHQTQSSYEYATAFYPLWSGVASVEQASAVAKNLPFFEQPGGLAMSRYESQAQWDFPYGWAPVHLVAVEGLRRCGYNAEADRITHEFLSMILRNFREERTLREKYDVVSGTAQTHIGVGYTQNVDGFGWTNAVFLELLHESPKELTVRLGRD